jgi:hypothetical protein
MSTTAIITFVLIGLALIGWGIVGHGTLRALAIGVGVVIFLLGLALDNDPRGDQRRWR